MSRLAVIRKENEYIVPFKWSIYSFLNSVNNPEKWDFVAEAKIKINPTRIWKI
jgi:hypothetical protein